MKKQIKIVKKDDEDSDLEYWLSLSGEERIANLERIRAEVIKEKNGTNPGFQRVCRIVKKKRRKTPQKLISNTSASSGGSNSKAPLFISGFIFKFSSFQI